MKLMTANLPVELATSIVPVLICHDRWVEVTPEGFDRVSVTVKDEGGARALFPPGTTFTQHHTKELT